MALMVGKLPAIRAVQGDYQYPLKNGGNSNMSCEPTMHNDLSNPNIYSKQLTRKGWHQQIGDHVSNPTDNPNATGLELLSSLGGGGRLESRIMTPRELINSKGPFY